MKIGNFFIIILASFFIYSLSWFVAFKTGINQLAIQSEDTLPAVFLPVTLIEEGTFYVDSYHEMLLDRYPHPDDKDFAKNLTPFYLRKISTTDGQHYISAFPMVAGLMAYPIYFVPVVLGMPITWANLALLSHLSAALVMALSGGFFYLLLRRHFFRGESNDTKPLLLTVIYLFATLNFALISQALWQQGPLQLFAILGLYFLLDALRGSDGVANGSDSSKNYALKIFLAGTFWGLAILSRPTAALPFLLLYILIFSRFLGEFKKLVKYSLLYMVGLIPSLLFFLWYNAKYYLDVANQGYANQATSQWLSRFPEGFLGLWISPSKGILVYSPVFIFSLVGVYLIARSFRKSEAPVKSANLKYLVFAGIVLIHTLVMGKWKHWYGGWSFGYRMASDAIPFMVLLIIPYVRSVLFEKTKKLFYALIIISVLIQISGILFFDGIWHAAYDRGFEDTGWLWSIKDSEFFFNFRRILVKLNLMEKACPQCMPQTP